MARLDHSISSGVSRIARRKPRGRTDASTAGRSAGGKLPPRRTDGLVREAFTLPREEARETARAFLDRYPREAYWSRIEHWQVLPDGCIEFTMVRLPTAD